MGQSHAIRVRVQPPYYTPGRAEDLCHKLPYQSQSDYGHPLSELRLCHPHSLQGNRPQRYRSGRLEVDVGWNLHTQVFGNPIYLGVAGVSRSSTGHAVAHGEFSCPFPHLQNHAGGAVAQGYGGVQTGAHRRNYVRDTTCFKATKELAHKVRPLERFAQQRLASQVDRRTFSPTADQRSLILDQHPSRQAARGWHLLHS
jgi:hypothetical protein